MRASRRPFHGLRALIVGVVLTIAASGCHSVPRMVPSWAWPPPLGVALLRGTLATEDPASSADPYVVYLVPAERVAPLPSFRREVVVRWQDGAFEPRSVALRLGAHVRIVNDGALQHRLFTAGAHPIRLDLLAHGEQVIPAGTGGPAHIYCSLHPSEYLLVYASDKRYVGTVASDGSWAIGPVAPGDYHLMLWGPSEGGLIREVRVWPWTVQRQNFRLRSESRRR